MILSIGAEKSMFIHQMDVKSAYLHLKNYLKTRQSQVCLGTLKDAQEFGQFLGNTRLPKHPG